MPRARSWTLLAALGLLALAPTAAAHEHVITDDCKFEFTVGWRVEPPFAGENNGLDLRVERITNTPDDPEECHGEHGHEGGFEPTKELVTAGVLGNVTITYSIAGKTYPSTAEEREAFDFRGQFGKPGYYTGEVTPTREGEYTIRIQGEIDGVPVDVSVVPAPIQAPESIMFPAKDLTAEEATARIEALEKQVAALKSQASSTPPPTPTVTGENGTPAVGALLVLAALGAVALAARKRQG